MDVLKDGVANSRGKETDDLGSSKLNEEIRVGVPVQGSVGGRTAKPKRGGVDVASDSGGWRRVVGVRAGRGGEERGSGKVELQGRREVCKGALSEVDGMMFWGAGWRSGRVWKVLPRG